MDVCSLLDMCQFEQELACQDDYATHVGECRIGRYLSGQDTGDVLTIMSINVSRTMVRAIDNGTGNVIKIVLYKERTSICLLDMRFVHVELAIQNIRRYDFY